MKRRFIRVLLSVAVVAGLLAGGTLLLIRGLGERDVLYHGKSQYYWIEQIKSSDITASNQANLVLQQEIIPGLTKTMFEDTNDSKFRLSLVEKLNGLPGVNIYALTADTRRANAANVLGEFGSPAEPAVPALLKALQGQDLAVRPPAAISLGKIRSKPEVIIPVLISYLDVEDVKEAAVEGLGDYGSLSKTAIPKLLVLFKDRDKSLHQAVTEALKKIDPNAAAQAGVRMDDHPPASPKTGDR